MPIKLIAHVLIEKDGKYLLIKRSKIKRGSPNMYPEYWDIPGGEYVIIMIGANTLLNQRFERSTTYQ